MPSLPLHPSLVHLPLGLAVVLPLLALGVALAVGRDLLPRRAWWVVVALQAALLLGGAAAFLSGGREEHRVERVVPGAAVHEHEERAEGFLWAAGITLGLAALAAFPTRLGRWARAATVAGAAVTAALALWTGHAGGQLVYRHGAAAAYAGGAGASPGPAGAAHAHDEARDHD